MAGTGQRRRRWLAAGTLLGAVGLLALGAWGLTRKTPGWWREPGAGAAQAGQRVENAVVSELSRARPAEAAEKRYRSDEWTIDITEDEANAWLTTRLKAWAENRGTRWPKDVVGVRVAFEDGLVRVGTRVMEDGVSRVVSAAGVVTIRDEAVWINVQSVAVGGLPVPRGYVLSLLKAAAGDGSLGAGLEGTEPVWSPAVMKLEDGRVVRVVGVEVERGLVRVGMRTEK